MFYSMCSTATGGIAGQVERQAVHTTWHHARGGGCWPRLSSTHKACDGRAAFLVLQLPFN